MNRILSALFAAILLAGCCAPSRSVALTPQIGVVKNSVERVAEKTSAAKSKADRAAEKVAVVYRDGAAPGSAAVAAIQSDVREIRGDLEAALVEVQNTRQQIETLKKIDADREAALRKAQDDLHKTREALRSRTKTLLVMALIVAGMVVYILRTPLLNAVGFFARKTAGLPW